MLVEINSTRNAAFTVAEVSGAVAADGRGGVAVGLGPRGVIGVGPATREARLRNATYAPTSRKSTQS